MFKNLKLKIILLLFILIGALLRFYNLNWDQGNFFHPDERNIANAVSRIHFFDQLNPQFFAYGGFSIYLYRITGEVLVLITKNPAWVYDWGHINLIGRFFSALFSTLAIPMIYLLAKSLFDKKVGLISAVFAAFTVSFIQTAHFGITESFITLMGMIVAFFSLRLLNNPTRAAYAICGFFLGLTVSSKVTTLSFAILPITAHILSVLSNKANFLKKQYFLFAFLIISIAVFTLFSPYTFIAWNKFLESMRYESGVATGTLPVPYTLQFTNTPSYLFQIKNLFWQLGPLAIFSVLGMVLLTIRTFKKRNIKIILFLLFPLVYFAYVGSWHTKFIRFMLPILPFLIISGVFFLHFIKTRNKLIGKILIITSLVLTAMWVVSFFSIYTKEQTRITASKWIYQNIPSGSKILGEHWDDGLPVSINSLSTSIYNIEQLTIYEPDNQAKIEYYTQKLSNADYIVINSRRLYGTLMNLEDKYPITSRYYKLLFSEELGYKKVAEFTSYPTIFGFEINDDSSEETFQVYDHPKVIIFKKIKRFPQKTLRNILQA